MARVDPRESVKMAQAVLQRMVEPRLIVDGRWGGYTHKAYSSAPIAIRLTVDGILAVGGTNPQSMLEATRVAERNYVPQDYDDIIVKESRAAGVSPTVMTKMLKIENARRDPMAVSSNGSSHGLFQITAKTWRGVLKNNGLTSPSWEQRYDPAANTKIACLLTAEYGRTLRGAGYRGEIDGRMIYLTHQQGPAAANEMYCRANGLPVKKSYLTEESMKHNRPASLTDKSAEAFSKYWWDKAGRVMN